VTTDAPKNAACSSNNINNNPNSQMCSMVLKRSVQAVLHLFIKIKVKVAGKAVNNA
jgi:hypothetical protein